MEKLTSRLLESDDLLHKSVGRKNLMQDVNGDWIQHVMDCDQENTIRLRPPTTRDNKIERKEE